MDDQYRWWREALAGAAVDSEVGNPRSGFWKASHDEPIAIWRDADGLLCCERMKFDGSRMKPDQIDELYSSASRYPLDEATYDAARADNPPFGYNTRLSLKEIQAGVVWSLDLGRKKLGPAPAEQAENPRAVIGGNNPPSEDTPTEGHTLAGEQTPDKLMYAEVSALGAQVKQWLASIGGKPSREDERAQIADYKTKFQRLFDRAEDERKREKKPFLDAGREVDDRWKRVTQQATASKVRCAEIYVAATKEEEARRAATAVETGAPAMPVASAGNLRSVPVREVASYLVTDARAYVEHLLKQDGDLPSEIVEAAGKVAQRRAEEAPGVEKKFQARAA